MKKTKWKWAKFCHAAAHIGIVFTHLHDAPALASLYALAFLGDLLELFGLRSRP